jgi:hypothetical protein
LSENFFSLELLVANNLVADDTKRSDFATGLTAAFQLTKKLEGFIEWDAVYQISGGDPGPRHYAVAGVVYFLTPNFAVDARTRVGLNESSNDILDGIGFAVRF